MKSDPLESQPLLPCQPQEQDRQAGTDVISLRLAFCLGDLPLLLGSEHPVLENHPAPITELSQKLRVDIQHALPGEWKNFLPALVVGEADGVSHVGLGEPSSLTRGQDMGRALLLDVDVGEGG